MSAIADAVARAEEFAPEFATWSGARRREALHACAAALETAGAEIVAVTGKETGLAEARLRGELDRTTGQLRLLGDHAATPWQRGSTGAATGGADVVTVPVPLGPVAVFAASNFPLAFGVPGGDTASALAAGCPVVIKAHPAQPQTGALLGDILRQSLPAGTVHVVSGGPEASLELVRAPAIRAVGFTGSPGGGRALMDAAAARPEPIPVYAEMGSLNPVFVYPGAGRDGNHVGSLAAAITSSSGQLCTKPGLIYTGSAEFARSLAAAVAAVPTHRMLTEAMLRAHRHWLGKAGGYGEIVAGSGDPAPFAVLVSGAPVAAELMEEHFGPAVVIVISEPDGYPQVVRGLPGSLTATVLATPADEPAARELLPALAQRAGRIIWNGVPTGVAVCTAMHHGGPWPASSASWSTSVGPESIERFRRPVAFQGVPAVLR